MHPKNLLIEDYTYALPVEKIALYPLSERDHSKLLIFKNGMISEDVYENIANHLSANSLMIFNDTSVIRARIIFPKKTGAEIEIFCLGPADNKSLMENELSKSGTVLFKCLIGGASKWKKGDLLEKQLSLHDASIILRAKYIEKISDRTGR